VSSPNLKPVLGWIVTLLVPAALVLAVVRLLLTPAYLQFEYNTPNFPADRYGFTKEERLHWARLAITYLTNDADISFLADLRFPEGERVPEPSCQFMDDCSRFYNERELRHMVDVKRVVKAALSIWYASLLGLLILGVWARRGDWWGIFRHGVSRGGRLTVILLGGIILFVMLAFSLIFVLFHQIFFQAGTWTFLYSDSLIRMFPERFWRDTFIVVGVLAGGAGLLVAYLFRQKT